MLFCLTANHTNADFALLDRVSQIPALEATRRLAELDFVRGVVVLSTCNRFEAYLDLDDPLPAAGAMATEAVVAALAVDAPEDAELLRASAATHTGDDAVHHLFAVTSGLESMVVGEEEIAGQVQRAAQQARRAGTASAALDRLFQQAARTSRTVRSAGDLSRADRSLARLALDLASSRITDWSRARVLLVGTGRYAATTIASLRARGADDIRVYSATGRAGLFATKYGVRAEAELAPAIAQADVVITCTARYTVAPEHVGAGDRRLLVIDLGLPRNVDPAVGALPGVELLDLELLALHAPLPELADSAHALVGGAVAEFAADAAAAPSIVALRQHIEQLLEDELARVRRTGDDGRIEAALRHFAGVLVHGPSERARRLAADGRLDAFADGIEAVYGVEVAPRLRSADDAATA
ncbi:glutamyl-tRNA reductase [Protaetiibacter larvae]|uniref:Glutamyl-tRNA reductase n=1 Tax=Protaetiibacter larvae TaxID=2592654 RepID=A0A5C1Y829_9MICO|nr:glutamyl-tRNA reductase [Protaetiibacter larvae]QEO09092.1 glutamyl-tRNA reductase [Protaetiibacter larvae]